MKAKLLDIVEESIRVKRETFTGNMEAIITAVGMVAAAFRQGNKVLLFGNGGSAADSQHIAAEFVGRFQKERASYPAIALTTDTSSLTAIGNDYGFDRVFSRQLEGLGKRGDVAIAISTSGNSPNVIEAVRTARNMQIASIALTGGDGGKLAGLADAAIVVPSKVTARIQEVHICVAHCLCELVEERLAV